MAENKIIILQHQTTILDSNRTLAVNGTIMEKLAGYLASIDTLSRDCALWQARLDEALANCSRIVEEISKERDKFEFLKKYLILSNDHELANNPILKNFLSLDAAYVNL